MNLVMLPMWVLSGIFFSSERFPERRSRSSRLLPLTPLNDALRAVMLEGEPLAVAAASAWPSCWPGGWSRFVLALRWFRWS